MMIGLLKKVNKAFRNKKVDERNKDDETPVKNGKPPIEDTEDK